MAGELERRRWSIVLVGNFNPQIIQPIWLGHHDIVPMEIAKSAEVNIIHEEISSSVVGPFRIEVGKTRFQVERTLPPEVTLLDFVSKLFGDVLPHSKITGFGINTSAHFRTSTPERRVEIGRRFAPIDPWGDFGKRLSGTNDDEIGGLMSLSMREILNDDDSKGHLEVKIEPSPVLDRRRGVRVSTNRHCSLTNIEDTDGAMPAIDKLDQIFADAVEQSESIIKFLAEMAK